VTVENSNLWVIDERLSYHQYLASDMPFEQMQEQVEVEEHGRKRPDLLIFNTVNAVVENTNDFQSIVIIEFKRPVRDDYNDDENPIDQVYTYIELLRAGKAKDRGGRFVQINETTPIYVYIIADITPKLTKRAKRATFKPTPDGKGFFGFNEDYRSYVEIIGFDKLILDAKKRNLVLFDKLGIK
jgi:hypothetical protein